MEVYGYEVWKEQFNDSTGDWEQEKVYDTATRESAEELARELNLKKTFP